MPDGSTRADRVANRGVLDGHHVVVEYYTSQPAPTQWVAVGLATVRNEDGLAPQTTLLVGTGRTEEAAVHELRGRVPVAERPAVTRSRSSRFHLFPRLDEQSAFVSG